MKTLMPFIVTVAVGCVSHAQPRFVQPVPPPTGDVLVLAQAPAPEALPAPGVAPAAPVPPKAPARVAASVRAEPGWGQMSLFKAGSRSSQTLVIPQSDFSPEKLADAEEDLNVMALILEKAVERRSDDDKYMGIGLLTSSSSGIKNLLIEGQGAIFMLKTKIALLPPPTPKKEETKTKESTSTEWEEARDQLYGRWDIDKHVEKALKDAKLSYGHSEEYDKEKVDRLRDSLTDALKSASNIRHLKGDQTVTVIVTSSSSSGYVREVRGLHDEISRAGGRAGGGASIYFKGDSSDKVESRSGTRLMLQAKKTDVDSYAKGKLTSETFRDKVKIQIY